jgi:hypothetical protein
LPSSHVEPLGYVTVQLEVPLHDLSTHSESAQEIAVPVQTSLPLQASP